MAVEKKTNRVGFGVVKLDSDEVVVVSGGRFLLDLNLQFLGRHRSKCHVVSLVQPDQRDESAETKITRFVAQPLPFSPSVGGSRVTSSVVLEVHGPHNSGLEVSSHVLVLEDAEVLASAKVSIHGAGESAACFATTEDRVVADDSALEAEEGSGVVLNDVVVESSA